MRLAVTLTVLVLSVAAAGCAAQQPWSFNIADFHGAKELPYDSPPQVIYRIDDHRFVTLEHYRDCNHGDTYYNDTKAGIHHYLDRGTIENYQGRVINADPTGRNLVFPGAAEPEYACSERGCNPWLMYSTNGGRTFSGFVYSRNNFKPFEYSTRYTVAVTKDTLYVAEKASSDMYVQAYPLNSLVNLNLPYPPGFEDRHAYASNKKLMPDNLHTPSGQDRVSCDASIKSTNPDAPLIRGDR
jgi:hypothetical protein